MEKNVLDASKYNIIKIFQHLFIQIDNTGTRSCIGQYVVTTHNQLYININNGADFKFSAHDPILEKPSSGDSLEQKGE
jgi:hypothetical protein